MKSYTQKKWNHIVKITKKKDIADRLLQLDRKYGTEFIELFLILKKTRYPKNVIKLNFYSFICTEIIIRQKLYTISAIKYILDEDFWILENLYPFLRIKNNIAYPVIKKCLIEQCNII